MGGSSTIAESFKAIRFGGIISQIGALPARGEVEKVDASVRAIQTQGIVRGILVGGRDVFEDFVRGLDKSRWHPVVDKVFEFGQAREVFDYLKVRPFMDCAHRVTESKTSRKSGHSRIIKDGI